MELIPASVDEIAVFKLSAVETYKKAGVDPKKAAALFEKTMGKLAGELGLVTEKKAIDLAPVASIADDVATLIATQMGKTRKQAKDKVGGLAAKIAEVIASKRAQAATPPQPPTGITAPSQQPISKQNVMGGTGITAPAAPKAPAAAMPKQQ